VDFDLVDKVVCGGLAAAGFGVLFNVGLPALPWCGASGALALLVRTLGLRAGWDLEAASLAASLALSSAVQLVHVRAGISRNALAVAGCIPMIPGSVAAKAILGMFALMSTAAPATPESVVSLAQNALRVAFTIGALGTGLAIPTMLLRLSVHSARPTGR
jgi:uncharacterized membrane protein YjjB (DUF3815 family)